MSQIYANAIEVHAWLGVAADGSDEVLVVCLLTEARRLIAAQDSDEQQKHVPAIIARRRRERKRRKFAINSYPEFESEEKLESVLSLLGRSYWSRVWIVQELLLAKSIEFYCGAFSLPWEAFVWLGLSLRSLVVKVWNSDIDYIVRLFGDGDRRRRVEATLHLINQILDGGLGRHYQLPLPTLLHIFQASQSSDVRDRVYGLLGLSSEVSSGSSLQVDYGKGPEDLFFNVMRLCHTEDSLRLAQLLLTTLNIRTSTPELLAAAKSIHILSPRRYDFEASKFRLELIYVRKLRKPKYAHLWWTYCDLHASEQHREFGIPRQYARETQKKMCEEDRTYVFDCCNKCLTLARDGARIGDRLYWFAGTEFGLIYCKTKKRSMFAHDTMEQTFVGRALLGTAFSKSQNTPGSCCVLSGAEKLCEEALKKIPILDKRSPSAWVDCGHEDFVRLLQGSNPKRITQPSTRSQSDFGTHYALVSRLLGGLAEAEIQNVQSDINTPYWRETLMPRARRTLNRKLMG